MKLLQLYYFKALAEREHLTATAAELYISPPSLSAAISRLETDLGVPLFDRVGRNIRLNDKGRQFYDHVKLALDELDKGFDELQSTAAWNRNLSLRVATSTHIIWEKPFADYICKHPHVAFSHRSLSLDQLLDSAETSPYDFIITHFTDLPSAEYDSRVLIPDDCPGLIVWCITPSPRWTGSLSLRPRTSPLSPSPRVFPCENTSIFCAKRPDFSPKSWPRPTIPSGPGW